MIGQRMRWVLTATLLLAVCGCLTVGRNFPSGEFSWIVKGKTTKDGVSGHLGEPFRVGVESGLTTWTYGYYKYRLGGETRTKDLVIYFNKDGTVSSYSFNTSFPEEKAAWRDRNEP